MNMDSLWLHLINGMNPAHTHNELDFMIHPEQAKQGDRLLTGAEQHFTVKHCRVLSSLRPSLQGAATVCAYMFSPPPPQRFSEKKFYRG